MNSDLVAWDMYFAGIVAMQFHPRNNVRMDKLLDKVNLALYAHVADLMMVERNKRKSGGMFDVSVSEEIGGASRSAAKAARGDRGRVGRGSSDDCPGEYESVGCFPREGEVSGPWLPPVGDLEFGRG